MKKFMEEFKAFAMRGNVLDMAIGVVIGGAFKAIADSLVNDIINPALGVFTGGHTDLSGLSFSLPGGGELMLGNFINAILNFLIMAFVVFCIVKAINNMHDKLSKPEPAEPERKTGADKGGAAARRDPRPFEGAEQVTALLREGLRELGLDESRAETLERFAALLLKKNEVMNLTAITEPEAVAQLHLLDSAALTRFVDLSGKTVVDVGTGAGFPGMPLRILKDDFDLTLLDSLGKRIAWLDEVCGTLGLKRVECVHARAEEFAAGHRESYDLAVSRAVAQLNVLCELALPLVKVGGQFLAMKSVGTEEEIAAAKGAIRTLGGKIVKVEDYTIPTSGVTHRAVVIEKVSPTPPRYPRAFAKIKKQPL